MWEWVSDWGAYVPTNTTWLNGDYIYGNGSPIGAAARGGSWGNGAFAGVFAFSAYNGPSGWDVSIGFRCGKSLRAGTWTSGAGIDILTDATPQLGADLDVNGNKIVSVSNGNIVLDANGTGSVYINAKSTFTGAALFTNKIVVRGAVTFNSSVTITVPDTQPAELWVSTSLVTPHLYVSTMGKVGIGTESPGEKLEVVGNVKAVTFYATSDERLKKDIRPMAGLDAILKLRGVRYNWAGTGEGDAGVLAQELEKVLPDAVRTYGPSGYKGVKYNYLVAPLIESDKELYAILETLKKENAELKTRLEADNTDFKTRLEAAEKKWEVCRDADD
jgi:hypothetical protein